MKKIFIFLTISFFAFSSFFTQCVGPDCCSSGTHWDFDLSRCVVSYIGDANNDGCIATDDLLQFLALFGNCQVDGGQNISGCMDIDACNYTSEADLPDQSCLYLGDNCDDGNALTGGDIIQGDCSCSGFDAFICGTNVVSYAGYDYNTVHIGTQCWLQENSRYLPVVSVPSEGSEIVPHYYVYDFTSTNTSDANQEANFEVYGVLYNYPATLVSGICPPGWRVPVDEDWRILEVGLGMSLASADVNGWRGSSQGAQIKSDIAWNGVATCGFNALPGGCRLDNGFGDLGIGGYWWCDSGVDFPSYGRYLNTAHSEIYRDIYNKSSGFSVRCVIGNPIVSGCVDPSACNYDILNTHSNGICDYPPTGDCDCYANQLDDCGVCGGDNSTCD